MARLRRTLLYLFCFLVLTLGIFVVNLVWFRPFSINLFFEKAFIEFALQRPELLSELRLFEQVGLHFHNDDLDDVSDAFEQKSNALVRKDLKLLKGYDRNSLNVKQQLSYDILEWYLEDQVRLQKFMYHDYPVTQLGGEHSSTPNFMATIHHLENKRDAEHYIVRLSKFDTKFDQVLEGLKIREKKGIIPPRFVIEKTRLQISKFIEHPTSKNLLYTSFEKKLESFRDLSAEDKREMLRKAEVQIRDTIYPAYRKLLAYMEGLEQKATTDDGVWKLPDGSAYYAALLEHHTTTSMTPEQVHQIGVREVERIENEMETILAGSGFHGKTVAEHMSELGSDPRFLYPETEEGKKHCLSDYQKIIDEVNAGMSSAFDIRPSVGVRVEPVPAFREKTAPGAYYQAPSLDGSRPGVFYLNMRDMKEIAKWGMRTLAYHEAIPGHHFQLALQRGITGVPMFRKIIPFTAYTEGWGLYAERLAWEMGFQKDPFNNLGRLQAELFRAVRLVVDTGIHSKRWTREQAIEYMRSHTGMPEGDVVAEVERYIVLPGQACAYKVGQMKILQLREKAKGALGNGFDLRKFHNVILQNGAMPLQILENQVDEYITSTK